MKDWNLVLIKIKVLIQAAVSTKIWTGQLKWNQAEKSKIFHLSISFYLSCHWKAQLILQVRLTISNNFIKEIPPESSFSVVPDPIKLTTKSSHLSKGSREKDNVNKGWHFRKVEFLWPWQSRVILNLIASWVLALLDQCLCHHMHLKEWHFQWVYDSHESCALEKVFKKSEPLLQNKDY